MTRDELQAQSLDKIKRLSIWMIVGYAVMVVAAIVSITLFAVGKYDNVLKEKTGTMTSSLDAQLKINLDNYLDRMEKVGTLAFSVDNAYTYDATDASNDEYEAINTEKQISDDLMSLCLMENFVDYGIVYSNNHTVGKVSNGTTQLFGDKLYTDLESMISRESTHDGWYTGYGNDYERIYYVKRIHENALFIISFYTSELDEVFDNPDTMSDMEIRLADSSYNMIYSSVKDDQLGAALPSRVLDQIKGKETAVVIGDNDLVTVNTSDGGWFVTCSIPTNIILKEAKELKTVIYIVAAAAAVVAVLVGTLFLRGIADPVKTITSSLSAELLEDGFEGVLGNRFFRDKASNSVSKTKSGQRSALVLIDVDGYDEMLARLEKSDVDKHLNQMVSNIKEIFKDADSIGRTGENSFAVLTKASDDVAETFMANLQHDCGYVCSMFSEDVRTATMGIVSLSASVGAAIYPDSGKSYPDVYAQAYGALSEAKKLGKGKFIINSED